MEYFFQIQWLFPFSRTRGNLENIIHDNTHGNTYEGNLPVSFPPVLDLTHNEADNLRNELRRCFKRWWAAFDDGVLGNSLISALYKK